MFNKKMLLALLTASCISEASLKVSQLSTQEYVVDEWQLAIDGKSYPVSFILNDDENNPVYQLVVLSAQAEDNTVLIQTNTFLLENGKKVLISAPVIRTEWDEKQELLISDDSGREWIYTFTPELEHNTLRIAQINNQEYIINEWQIPLDGKEFPQSFAFSDEVSKTDYQLVVASAQVEEDEQTLINAHVYIIKNGRKMLISSPIIRAHMDEEMLINITDDSGKVWTYAFVTEQD